MGDRELRVVTESDADNGVGELARAIREQTDALKRFVDEFVRDRQERKRAQSSGRKRAETIRKAPRAPRTFSAEAHAAADKFVARLGRSR